MNSGNFSLLLSFLFYFFWLLLPNSKKDVVQQKKHKDLSSAILTYVVYKCRYPFMILI